MKGSFDSEEAKKYLLEKEKQEKLARESERKDVLEKSIAVLKKEFEGSSVEVYLIGSLIKPFAFSLHSDIDIVLKNYTEDRFHLWVTLEEKIGRKVEIILFETCRFQEFVVKEGLKVV